jgi:hypothetical protein
MFKFSKSEEQSTKAALLVWKVHAWQGEGNSRKLQIGLAIKTLPLQSRPKLKPQPRQRCRPPQTCRCRNLCRRCLAPGIQRLRCHCRVVEQLTISCRNRQTPGNNNSPPNLLHTLNLPAPPRSPVVKMPGNQVPRAISQLNPPLLTSPQVPRVNRPLQLSERLCHRADQEPLLRYSFLRGIAVVRALVVTGRSTPYHSANAAVAPVAEG